MEILNRWEPKIRFLAYREASRWNFRIRPLDLEDLVQYGYLKFISLYRENRIDWNNVGVNLFLEKSITGHLKNILNKLPLEEELDPGVHTSQGPEMTPTFLDGPAPSFGSWESSQTARTILGDIKDYVENLATPDMVVLIFRVLDGRSLEEVGQILATSRETIRRREKELRSEMLAFLRRRGWDLADPEEIP